MEEWPSVAPAGGLSLDSVFDVGSNPVAPTILLASLFCGSFWGFTWFNRKVQFSLFIARLVTTSFAVVTWRVQILLPVWHGEPRPKNYLDDLSNSGPAVRQIVKAGNSARPKTVTLKAVS